MSGDAQPNSKQRATEGHSPPSPPLIKEKAAIGALCVVCGDRACSHLYYGVAACHGCKCFFWRTVKSKLNYTCRYGGSCSISASGRNACRFCRFNQCLSVGMKIEAVKMDRKIIKRKKKEIDSDEFDENQENNEYHDVKRTKSDNRLLVTSLVLIDTTSSNGNAKQAFYHSVEPTLGNLIEEPILLDGYRTEMSYRAEHPADEKLCYDAERRLVTWAIDWCRQIADIEDSMDTNDKIALLRSSAASLALLELSFNSIGNSDRRIRLCNNSYFSTTGITPTNSFISSKSIESLTKWTNCELKPLSLQLKELVLLKALIVLNPDTTGLSQLGEESVRMLRKRVYSALFEHICSKEMDVVAAGARLSSILLLIPQLTLMALEVKEQVRLRNFYSRMSNRPYGRNELLFSQFYGDLIDEPNHDDYMLEHSASCSPTDSQYATDSS